MDMDMDVYEPVWHCEYVDLSSVCVVLVEFGSNMCDSGARSVWVCGHNSEITTMYQLQIWRCNFLKEMKYLNLCFSLYAHEEKQTVTKIMLMQCTMKTTNGN